ncbi:MAG TPA: sodium:calcium antiporter, partial [Actinomycetota bacterium]
MVADVIGLVVSLAMLTVAGDQFVVGAARLATVMRIRPSVVGAVIGGLGASLPELLVSTVASVSREPQIAVGNLVGSNIAHVSLALAIAALVAPIRVDSRTIRREGPLSVAAVLLFALLLQGGLSQAEGLALLLGLVLALAAMLANARMTPRGDELTVEVRRFFGRRTQQRLVAEMVRTLGGLALMLVGAEVLVRSASGMAHRLGIGEGFVGLTVVAVGTTAPLVAIAVQAARRGNHDLVAGSVLGSNLFVALAGGALVGILRGGPEAAVDLVAVWVMVAIAAAAWVFMARRSLVTRWEALALV